MIEDSKQFDKMEYPEDYFQCVEKREETRKYVLTETSAKVDQL